jgi:hypothetical protein
MPNKQKSKGSSKKLNSQPFSKQTLIIFAAVFAIIGGYVIFRTFAAPPPDGPPPTINNFYGSPNPMQYGGADVNLVIVTTSDTDGYCDIASSFYNGRVTFIAGSQRVTASPTFHASSAFGANITCANAGGTVSASTSVGMNPPPPTPTVSLTANPSTIAQGQSSTLTWSSTNTTSCALSWHGYGYPSSGSDSVSPAAGTYSYNISCAGTDGNNYGASANLTVNTGSAPSPPSIVFRTSSSSIAKGSTVSLSWSVTSATSCNGSGDWSGQKTASTNSGENVGPLNTVKTYSFTLTCYNGGVSSSASVQVQVTSSPPPPGSSPPPSSNPRPTLSLKPTQSSIAYNGSSYLQWSATNASSCSAPWTGSHKTIDTQKVGPLTGSTTYTIICNGAGGSVSATTRITVAAKPTGCATNCPIPAAPAAPTTALEPPPPDTTIVDQSDTGQNENTQKKSNSKHLLSLLLGGLLGELINVVKHSGN